MSCPIIQEWGGHLWRFRGLLLEAVLPILLLFLRIEKKSVAFVDIVYNGELLGFLGQTSNVFTMRLFIVHK